MSHYSVPSASPFHKCELKCVCVCALTWKQWPMLTIEGAVSHPVSMSSHRTPHSCSPLRKRNTSTWRRGSRMDYPEYALLFPCSHISPRYILVRAKSNDHGQELSMGKDALNALCSQMGTSQWPLNGWRVGRTTKHREELWLTESLCSPSWPSRATVQSHCPATS